MQRNNTRISKIGAGLILIYLPFCSTLSRADVFEQGAGDTMVEAAVGEVSPILDPETDQPRLSASAVVYDRIESETEDVPKSERPTARASRTALRRAAIRIIVSDVADLYARHPGVTAAKLDRSAFVALFSALIERESNFHPLALSPKGAMGLGQLMPQTARSLGVCDPFEPQDNLVGSVRYFTAMLEEFGSPALALAAYNAGPNAVRRFGGIPPYRETQNYVRAILSATQATQASSMLSDEDRREKTDVRIDKASKTSLSFATFRKACAPAITTENAHTKDRDRI